MRKISLAVIICVLLVNHSAYASNPNWKSLSKSKIDFPKQVWNEAKSRIKNKVNYQFDVFKGPNTQVPFDESDYQKAISVPHSLLPNFAHQTKFKFFIYSYSDVQLVSNEVDKLPEVFPVSDKFSDQVKQSCQSPENCEAAFGEISTDLGFVMKSIPEPINRGSQFKRLNKVNFAHEITHTIQKSIYKENGLDRYWESVPCWLREGQPQFIGTLSAAENLNDYKLYRSQMAKLGPNGIPNYSAKSIEDFIDSQTKFPCNSIVRIHNYNIGFFMVEALSAYRGIDSSMNLILEISKGKNFEMAFMDTYGINWNLGKSDLAKLISTEFAKA